MSAELTPGLELANSVTVYLDWNDAERSWECAPVTMDGGPLDMLHNTEGDLDRSQWSDADRAAARRADDTPAPTGAELIKLMAQYLPEDTQIEQENAAHAVKRAAENASNDDQIQALQEYVAMLENILGFTDPTEEN